MRLFLVSLLFFSPLSLCAQQMNPRQIKGTAIVQNPSGSQSLNKINSVDYVLYADQCSGADMGARINSCVALLPTVSSGYKVGTIILPNTTSNPSMTVWSTTAVLGPGVNLLGQGVLASAFTCTATSCLQHNASGSCILPAQCPNETSGSEYAHTVGVSAVWQGFTITGTGGASSQDIIELIDAQNLTLRDMGVDGGSSPGSSCIHLHDYKWWTERNTFENVSTLYGCAIGWRFTADASNPNQPHPSFGYNRFLDIKANPNNGQTGFSMEGNSYIYNCTFRMTINVDQTGNPASVMIHMQDGAEFYENELHMFGEGPSRYVLQLGSTNEFTYMGQINVGPQTNSIAVGAVLIHWGDDGGFGPDTATAFSHAIYSAVGNAIASGEDMNTITACGYYQGSGLRNTPSAIGVKFLKFETVCSNASGYITQNAYMTTFTTGQQTRQWQRVRDSGTWGAWREVVWQDELSTATPVANHAVCVKKVGPPITFGYCSTVVGTSGACTCN